eukprot:COSAG02_NODE_18419_length_939_cov_13.185714_1_plen_234_part_01
MRNIESTTFYRRSDTTFPYRGSESVCGQSEHRWSAPPHPVGSQPSGFGLPKLGGQFFWHSGLAGLSTRRTTRVVLPGIYSARCQAKKRCSRCKLHDCSGPEGARGGNLAEAAKRRRLAGPVRDQVARARRVGVARNCRPRRTSQLRGAHREGARQALVCVVDRVDSRDTLLSQRYVAFATLSLSGLQPVADLCWPSCCCRPLAIRKNSKSGTDSHEDGGFSMIQGCSSELPLFF